MVSRQRLALASEVMPSSFWYSKIYIVPDIYLLLERSRLKLGVYSSPSVRQLQYKQIGEVVFERDAGFCLRKECLLVGLEPLFAPKKSIIYLCEIKHNALD